MIALDTNVLVRLLLGDDAAQAQRARKLFDASASKDGSLFVSDAVLAELGWVLRSRYSLEAEAIAGALRALLGNATIGWQSPSAVAAALQTFEAHPNVDFSDCLVVALAQAHDCDAVATFDRGMQGMSGVRLM